MTKDEMIKRIAELAKATNADEVNEREALEIMVERKEYIDAWQTARKRYNMNRKRENNMTYKIMVVTEDDTERETSYRDLDKDLAVEIAKRLTRMMSDRYYFYPMPEDWDC